MSDTLFSVLNYMDDQIHENGVCRLKFVLYPVLRWIELEKCVRPSEMYHLLEASLESREKALQMFLFALRAIGGSARGKHCAEVAVMRLGPDLIPPDLDFNQQPKQFQFFFWLLKIERRLPESFREIVKQHFSKDLGVNYRFIEGLPDLFIRLYRGKKLHENNTGELVAVLQKCKEQYTEGSRSHSDLVKCMSYLFNMHHEEVDPFSSGDEASTAVSMHDTESLEGQKRNLKKRRVGKRKKVNSQSGTTTPNHSLAIDIDSPAPKDTESSVEIYPSSVPDGLTDSVVFVPDPGARKQPTRDAIDPSVTLTAETVGSVALLASGSMSINIGNDEVGAWCDNHPLALSHQRTAEMIDNAAGQDAGNKVQSNNCEWLTRKCIISAIALLVVPLLLVGVIIIPVCSKFVWKPLHELPSHTVQHREGSVAILAQLDPFLTKQFHVQQKIDFDDSLHRIAIVVSDSGCDAVSTLTTRLCYSGTQAGSQSTNPVYMLQHSQIEANICASTTNPENNPLMFYIVKSIEDYMHFDQIRPSYYHRSIPVGRNDEQRCTQITKNINERDYYSVRFRNHPGITFTFNLTMIVRYVNINATSATLLGVLSPQDDDGDELIGETLSFGTKKLCLFADIKESSMTSTNNYTTLETILEPRYGAALGITVSTTVAFFLWIVAVESVACFVFRRKYSSCTRHGYTRIV